jgi:xanthine/uracil permease
MSETRAVHPVDEVMPQGRMVAYGLQHVLAMYAGVIAVPLILATAIGLPQEQLVYAVNSSFLMCGPATLLQTIGLWKFGVRLPIVQGTTFASVTPMILSRVDLTETRNPIIVAVSIAFGVIPAALPEFYDEFPDAVRIIFESGITAASVAAILLNIVFNVIGGTSETTACMPTVEEV